MIAFAAHAPAMSRLLAEISVERLRELQRFAEVGRVSASLIHDMSSPLTAALLHLERDGSSVRHARRSIRVLERYIEAARQQLRQQDCMTTFCVKREIDQAKHILRPLARQRQINLRFSIPASHKLVGDPVRFQRVIANLVTNAMDAYAEAGPAGQSFVWVSVTERRPWLVVRVRDWGEGISPDHLPHIFEPFYTTKEPRTASGTGIGLSTVKQYVEDCFKGRISVTSRVGRGTEFLVELPLPAAPLGNE